MWVLVGFAFISGIITILSPCILPILPVVLSGGVSGGKARPFGVVTGFVASFVAFTLSLSALVNATGMSPEIPRYIAVFILIAFGVIMVVPALRYRFELWVSGFVSRSKGLRVAPANVSTKRAAGVGAAVGIANDPPKVATERVMSDPGADRVSGPMAASTATDAVSASQESRPTARVCALSGYGSGIVMGLGLGIVWTPCVGPIMASVISLAVGNSVDAGAVVITLAYAVGTAIPMLAVMLGGKALIAKAPWLLRRSDGIQRVFGVLMLVVGVVVLFGWERQFQTAVLNAAPGYGSGLTAIEDNESVRKALAERTAVANNRTNGTSASGETMTGVTIMGAMTGNVSGTNTRAPVFSGAGSTRLLGGRTGDYGYAPQLVAEGPWIIIPNP